MSRKMSKKNYIPLKGFYDLNEFALHDDVFNKFYNIQLYLYHCEAARLRGYYKHREAEFQRVKELSAQYQMLLLSYPERKPYDFVHLSLIL